MKKFARVLCLALVALTLCATLASCGKVSGAYSGEADFGLGSVTVTYDFGMFKKVTLTVVSKTITGASETKTYEGKYEIIEHEDDTMSIKFTFEDENADSYEGEKTFSIDKENDTIKIGLFTYTKAD